MQHRSFTDLAPEHDDEDLSELFTKSASIISSPTSLSSLKAPNMKLNPMQRAVLKDYADGDYANHFDEDEHIDLALLDLGDGLLTFMLTELSTDQDCDSIETGVGRLLTAKDDIDVALLALAKLHEAILKKTLEDQGVTTTHVVNADDILPTNLPE